MGSHAAPSTNGSLSMVQHVCGVIRSINGRWPRPDSFFTSVGVDSLGAVIFVRNLSDSLGGAKISQSDVFDSQLTIFAFSKKIFEEISATNPDTLKELNIDRAVDLDGSVEDGGRDAEHDVEADTELGFLSNWRLYEGMRGVFTFMVLWDHYDPPNSEFLSMLYIVDNVLSLQGRFVLRRYRFIRRSLWVYRSGPVARAAAAEPRARIGNKGEATLRLAIIHDQPRRGSAACVLGLLNRRRPGVE